VPAWAGPQYTVPPAAAQTMPQPEAVTEGPAPTPLVTVYPRTAGTAARSGSLGANEPKVPVPLYTYEQLERMNTRLLMSRATDLRDAVGADNVPPLPMNQQHEIVVNWMMNVQVELARSSGLDVSADHFGLPKEGVYGERSARSHASRPAV